MKMDGRIKGVVTKTKADPEGIIEHITRVSLEFTDLNRDVLELMADAEFWKKHVTLDVEGTQQH